MQIPKPFLGLRKSIPIAKLVVSGFAFKGSYWEFLASLVCNKPFGQRRVLQGCALVSNSNREF